MKINNIHKFNIPPKEAIKLQKQLKERLIFEVLNRKDIRYIAGVDVSFRRKTNCVYAALIILRYNDFSLVEYALLKDKVSYPYIPGLLSFREIPPLLELFKRIENKPDLILVDGQGIAHPRGIGLASHLGLLLDIPTIGIAKKILVGKTKESIKEKVFIPLFYKNKIVGYCYQKKARQKPLIISPGYKVDFSSTKEIVKDIIERSLYKSPMPLYFAHKLSYKFGKETEKK